MKRMLAAVTATLAAVGTATGCSASQTSPTPPPSASTVAPASPSVPTALPTTETLKYTNTTVAGKKIKIPSAWTEAIVPGADKGYLVTTAPGAQTVGITLINSASVPVTESVLQQIANTVKIVNENSDVETKLIASNLGEVTIVRNDTKTLGWIMSTKKGTFLVTLGSPYVVTTGKPKPQPVPTAFAPGAADQQVREMVDLNLAR